MALNECAAQLSGKISLIPLRLDECQISELRQQDHSVSLLDYQWLDYFEEDGFEQLVRAIEHYFPSQPAAQINWKDKTKRKAFRLALQEAYPEPADLEIFVDEELNENLAAVAGGNNLQVTSHSLVKWARAKGRLDEVFNAFKQNNPNHSVIATLERQDTVTRQFNLSAADWDALFNVFNPDDLADLSRAFKKGFHQALQIEFRRARPDHTAFTDLLQIREALEQYDVEPDGLILAVRFAESAISELQRSDEVGERDLTALEEWCQQITQQFDVPLHEQESNTSPQIREEEISDFYSINVIFPSGPLTIGSEIDIGIKLNFLDLVSAEDCFLEIPKESHSENEINIFLIAPGFQCKGTNVASLPLIHDRDLSVLNRQSSQTANFPLVALQPGTNTIRAEIFLGNELQSVLTRDIQVSQADAFATNQLISSRPRPVTQPDLILQIQTGWNETLANCTFNYHLDSFHPRLAFACEIQQRSEAFSAEWLAQTRRFLQNTLEEVGSSLPKDLRSRLASLGKQLLQQLLPQELQMTFRSIMRLNVPFTLLILADQDAEFPWELLHDGQSFWGERFIMGRWPLEMEKTRPYEFAIGAVSLAHYENVEQPEQWSGLLEPSGAPPPMMLSDGVLADLGSVEVMRGLHLLRRGTSPEEIERQDAPVPLESNGSEDLDQSLRPAKLSLRRNRPLVTLGYLNAGVPELTTLEHTWAPTFIRSGCSTFIGPLWAVQPAVETAFTSSFYHRLWAGESLGMAFQAGRRAAKAVAPDLLDWMAYVLYGDPMARPYRPTVGKGYAVVEPIGQEITDRVTPGSSVRFRVSLRRTPPVWYSDRLMDVSEDLAFEDLQVYIVASGLQVTPSDSIDMQ